MARSRPERRPNPAVVIALTLAPALLAAAALPAIFEPSLSAPPITKVRAWSHDLDAAGPGEMPPDVADEADPREADGGEPRTTPGSPGAAASPSPSPRTTASTPETSAGQVGRPAEGRREPASVRGRPPRSSGTR